MEHDQDVPYLLARADRAISESRRLRAERDSVLQRATAYVDSAGRRSALFMPDAEILQAIRARQTASERERSVADVSSHDLHPRHRLSPERPDPN
jgi:hypothetical protein